MIHFICRDFERLGLHDSFITSIIRNNDEIVIGLSHGYLSDFIEGGIYEAIMFDAAILTVSNVKNEQYRSTIKSNAEMRIVDKPDLFDTAYSLIATNNIIITSNFTTLNISVIKDQYIEDCYFYVEWEIIFESIKLEWSKHISHRNWLNETEML